MDAAKSQSRGYGFVNFPKRRAAEVAMIWWVLPYKTCHYMSWVGLSYSRDHTKEGVCVCVWGGGGGGQWAFSTFPFGLTLHLSKLLCMKSLVLHTVWCYISGEAAWEIWNWSLLGVSNSRWPNVQGLYPDLVFPACKTLSCMEGPCSLVGAKSWKKTATHRLVSQWSQNPCCRLP